jgi:hypothetical protein
MVLRRQGDDVLFRAIAGRAQFVERKLRAGAAPNPSSIRRAFAAPERSGEKVPRLPRELGNPRAGERPRSAVRRAILPTGTSAVCCASRHSYTVPAART